MKRLFLLSLIAILTYPSLSAQSYKIVGTGQDACYEDIGRFPPTPSGAPFCPAKGKPYYGQDAQYAGVEPEYQFYKNDNAVAQEKSERIVLDQNTGLMWMHHLATNDLDLETPNRFTFKEAKEFVAKMNSQNYGGFNDWRIPEIKELYSLILFTGSSMAIPPVPYCNTAFFEYIPPQTSMESPGPGGFRPIDGQFWSSTEYAGRILEGQAAAFGVNFADGRIKAYPIETPGRSGKLAMHYLRCVRGPKYGINRFKDNGDGTITDEATGLMWTEFDSNNTKMFACKSPTMDWEAALNVAENLDFAGHQDWRLPNAKELQSIVDYTRAPFPADLPHRGPAIDPIFQMPDPGAWYWTGTTHLEDRNGRGAFAVTICFGPGTSIGRQGELIDIHGAGAQRSCPKSKRVSRPEWLENGLGPQRDEVRINNYIRCVRKM